MSRLLLVLKVKMAQQQQHYFTLVVRTSSAKITFTLFSEHTHLNPVIQSVQKKSEKRLEGVAQIPNQASKTLSSDLICTKMSFHRRRIQGQK